MTARLLIGPLLRRVAGDRATIWVETSAPATVGVRAGDAAAEADTFTAFGHHYALVVLAGLPLDAATPYQVTLDGVPAWPLPESTYPASVIRTRAADDAGQPVRVVFGSCREASPVTVGQRLPPDALDAYARRLGATGEPMRDWPDVLALLGDQVYADVTSRKIRRWLKRRRRRASGAPDGSPPDQVVTYEEYTRLYLESWRDPDIRWLLSTVPSVMIFDDHEIIDDWNTSASWRADMKREPWWRERIAAGLASYWVYQHLGNLHPDELADDQMYGKVLAAGDATDLLREFGQRVDSEGDVGHDRARWEATQYQWSFALDIGRTRVVVLDNRCSRVLEPRARTMLPEGEWEWFTDRVRGDYDHLLVGSSLPWLLPPGIHHLEAWNERLCASPRPLVAAAAERLRRAWDLEHWAAFRRSFEALGALLAQLGTTGAGGGPGPVPADAPPADRGTPPASISVLSGDVHHSYVARVGYGPEVSSPVHQITCSPIHNEVPAPMRPLMRLGWARRPAAATRALAAAAGLPAPPVRWRKVAGPYFGNAVATLVHVGRAAHVTIEGTTPDGHLDTSMRVRLAG